MTLDYAFIYAKLARHVAAADALLNYDTREAGKALQVAMAAKELQAAMAAIAVFETTSIIIPTHDD